MKTSESPWRTEVQDEVTVPGRVGPLVPRILRQFVALEITERTMETLQGLTVFTFTTTVSSVTQPLIESFHHRYDSSSRPKMLVVHLFISDILICVKSSCQILTDKLIDNRRLYMKAGLWKWVLRRLFTNKRASLNSCFAATTEGNCCERSLTSFTVKHFWFLTAITWLLDANCECRSASKQTWMEICTDYILILLRALMIFNEI